MALNENDKNVSTSIPASSFLSNIAKLMMGNIGAQIILLVTLPVITRLYDPEAYGLLAIFVSISLVLIGVSPLRFNAVILLPKKESDALNVMALSLGVVVCIAALTVFFLIFFRNIICLYLNLDSISYYWLLPINIWLGGWYLVFSFWYTRKGQFGNLAFSRIAEVASDKCFVILGGFLLNGSTILLLSGLLLGKIVSIATIGWRTFEEEIDNLKNSVSLKTMKELATRYQSFARYSGWIFLNSLSRELPALFLGLFFGSSIVGFYALSNRVLAQPLIAMGDSISRSFFQKISEIQRSGKNIAMPVQEMFEYLLLLVVFPMFLLSLIAPAAVELVFGENWMPAADYVRIMWAFFVCPFIFRPLSVVLDILERQRARFIINLSILGASGVGLIYGLMYRDPLKCILGFVVVNTFVYGVVIAWILKISGIAYFQTLKIFTRVMTLSFLAGISSLFLQNINKFSNLSVITLGIISLFLYFALIVAMDKRMKLYVITACVRYLK